MSGDQQLGAIQGQVSSLFVTNIPPQISESDLFAVYSSNDSTNRIQSLRIVRSVDGVARYAYLNFVSPEEAQDVLTNMNYKVHDGCTITLAKNIKPQSLDPNANLYCSGFSNQIGDKDLHDAFVKFGPIVSVRTRVINADGINKCSAYIQYENPESAEAAVASIQQSGLVLPNGQVEKVIIDRFKPRSDRVHQFTNVFVRNFPINFTQEQFKALAERFGPVTSVYLPTQVAPKPGTTAPSKTGFGFANFANADDARKAIESLCEEVIGDFKLQAFKAQDRDARRREVDENSAKFTRSSRSSGPQRNHQRIPRPSPAIFLRALPADVTLQQLTEKLSVYGEIDSLIKKAQNSFVCRFAKLEYAQAALAALAKTYTVSYHNPASGFGFNKRYGRGYRQHPRHHMRPHRSYAPRYNYGYPPYGYPPQVPGFPYMQHPQGPHPQGPHPQQQGHPQRMNTRRQRLQQQNGLQQPQNGQMQQTAQAATSAGPLTEEERQQLGSTLYYKIAASVGNNTELTSKITGMLLELPGDDVRTLVTNPSALSAKVQEARTVLGSQ